MKKKNKAFTLAEVLITLTIIGVIAAMTIPNLMQSYRKHQVEVGVKTAYSLLNNALTMAKAEHGSLVEAMELSNASDNPKKYFSQNYVEPYLKVTKTTEPLQSANTIFNDTSLKRIDGSVANQALTNPYAWRQLQLQNGMFLGVSRDTLASRLIYYFVFDINGNKGPNQIAHDIFYFSLEPTEPNKLYAGAYGQGGDGGCGSLSGAVNNWGGVACSSRIMYNGWKIPDDYPVKKF